MRKLLLLSLFCLAPAVAGSEEPYYAVAVHGRPALHPETAVTAASSGADVGVYQGEPVMLTVTAFNDSSDTDVWLQHIQWLVTTGDSEPVAAKIRRDTDATVQAPYAYRIQRNTTSAAFRIDSLPAGRYLVAVSWLDPVSGERRTSRREGLAVYRGDETPLIRAWFLRDRARAALLAGTRESYEAARGMLLQAASDNDDPSFYEELADISLPWAPPGETAAYYDKSLAIARANLEKTYGQERDWPERAWRLYRPQARKVERFRALVPEYAIKFQDMKIVVARRQTGDAFVIQRRSDGKELRVVELRE
jgi:hypothetical protein